MPKNRREHIFISAAEPSADSHCAGLIKALKSSGIEFEFSGVGGEKMASAGCNLLEETAGKAAMIYKAFWRIFYFYKLIRRIRKYLNEQKPDLVIVCDSPAFNFHVAKAAKKAGLKTFFYVAPQLWAWGGWRIRKLRKCCDMLACILPFEEQWFSQRGINTVFVGNPLLGEPSGDLKGQNSYEHFEPEKAKISLMPGSRQAEINSLWKPMQQIALGIQERYPSVVFEAVAVDAEKKEQLQSSQIPGFSCEYKTGSVGRTALQTDLAIVASGSVTLQVAAAGTPMVVLYQSSRILWYLIGRWLIKTEHFSLVNILARKELVPEFMPYFRSTGPVVSECLRLLDDKDELSEISRELLAITRGLAKENADKKTAGLVLDMLSKDGAESGN